MPDQSRVRWVDAGRGVAILLVALYHSARWLSSAGADTAGWQTVNAALSTLRMPVFFMISGMFARKWVTGSWRSLLSDKVFFLAWVFGVWEVVGTVFFYVGNTLIGQPLGVRNMVTALLLAPVLPQLELWFIWALAWFFILAKLVSRLPHWAQLAGAGAVSALALTVWYSQTTGPIGAAKFFFFFLIGLHLREHLEKVAGMNAWLAVGAVAVWLVVSVLSAGFGLAALPGWFFFNCCLGVVAGISLARLGARLRFLRYLGRNTLPVYVAHTPLILTGVSVLYVARLVPPGADVLVTPALAAIAVVGALGLRVLVSRGSMAWLYAPAPRAGAWVRNRLNQGGIRRPRVPGTHERRGPGRTEGPGDDSAVREP